MSESSSIDDELGPLAASFLERFRRGERPSLHEYTERHPRLADQIREAFPALVELENFGSVATGCRIGGLWVFWTTRPVRSA